jgi:hypothetical protein
MRAHIFGLIGWLIAALAGGNSKMNRSFELIGPQKITINSNTRDVEEVVRLSLVAVNPRLRQDAERILNSGGTVGLGRFRCRLMVSSGNPKSPFPTRHS